MVSRILQSSEDVREGTAAFAEKRKPRFAASEMDGAELTDRPNLPLAGVTVIDLGQIYQGPYATMLMAKAGANVIKVEPLNGEPIRARTKVGRHAALPFAMLNSNKRAVHARSQGRGGARCCSSAWWRAPTCCWRISRPA